jgi:uncharacterized membrane protein YkvA (DUF1232 family)
MPGAGFEPALPEGKGILSPPRLPAPPPGPVQNDTGAGTVKVMPEWAPAVLVVAALGLVALVALRRRMDTARAVAVFVPNCAVLFSRLARDGRIPRRHRALVALLALYLASPIDIVPDFVPVLGQLDDAIVVAVLLRRLLRTAGPEILEEHWPGSASSLVRLRTLAGMPIA